MGKPGNQLMFEDVTVGAEIPGIVKLPSSRQAVRWCGLRDEYYELHYDKDYALNQGFPGVLLQGEMIVSFLGQMLMLWLGNSGFVRRLTYGFNSPILINEKILCKGKVTHKYTENGNRYIDCEAWIEKTDGSKPVTAKAQIIFNKCC